MTAPKHKKRAHHHIDVLDIATKLAKSRDERMTDLRTAVLQIFMAHPAPLGAYDLRDKINSKRNKKIEPASIYRCLDFFVSLGVVVKLESQNSFMLCQHIGEQHQHVLMLCNTCGTTSELHDDQAIARLDKQAKASGFIPSHHVLEIHGLCRSCQ